MGVMRGDAGRDGAARGLVARLPWLLLAALLLVAAAGRMTRWGLACIGFTIWDTDDVSAMAWVAGSLAAYAAVPALLYLHVRSARGAIDARAHCAAALLALGFWAAVGFQSGGLLVRYGAQAVAIIGEVREQRSRPGIEVSPDGTDISLHMEFVDGISDRFAALVRANPRVRTVTLSGPGGQAWEGVAVARMILARGLDTRVLEECHSSCAIAFLAGRRRTLRVGEAEGLLGFHPAHTYEGGRRVRGEPGFISGAMDEVMRRSGAGAGFVWKVWDTPPETVWRPTPSDLAAAGVPVATVTDEDAPGTSWGTRRPAEAETLADIDPSGQVIPVVAAHEPGFLAGVLRDMATDRDAGRNEMATIRDARDALGERLSRLLASAPDRDVLKAGAYVMAAMEVARSQDPDACVAIGRAPNLLKVAAMLPGPPGAASDPDAPYGALVARAYASSAAGDGAASAGRMPGATCDGLLARYAEATRPGGGDVSFLRGRFASYVRAGRR